MDCEKIAEELIELSEKLEKLSVITYKLALKLHRKIIRYECDETITTVIRS